MAHPARPLCAVCATACLFWSLNSLLAAPAKGAADIERAIVAADYDQARKLAETSAKSGVSTERVMGLFALGRIALSTGRRDDAAKVLSLLRSEKLDADGEQLLRVYDAWLKGLAGKADASIAELQAILKAQASVQATAEAAEVLARFHALRGDKAQVQNAIQFGRQHLKYQDIRSAYLEGLYKRQLEEVEIAGLDPAERDYRRAESLRMARQFEPAFAAYQKLLTDHPQSPWVHPAGFRLGECLLGAGKTAAALKHWEAFLATMPAGPWRGQAHVAVIDLALEEQFDLKLANRHAQAAEAILTSRELAPRESWDAAALEIYLRVGMVALVENRFAAAVKGFDAAHKAAQDQSAEMRRGLVRLLAAAKAEEPLVPKDVAIGAESVGLQVAVALMHALVGHHERALSLLERIADGRTRQATPAQRAFAAYRAGRVYEATGKLPTAKTAYQASLKGNPTGSWHAETHAHTALIIQRLAEDLPATPRPPVAPAPAGKAPAPKALPGKNQEREAAQQESKQRLTARREALPHWQQIVQRYPDAPQVEAALYHIGCLEYEADRPGAAIDAWTALLRKAPEGPFAGEVRVRMINLELELRFDLAAAAQHSEAALKWLKEGKVAATPASPPASPAAAPDEDSPPANPRTSRVAYDIYLRAGLIAWINRQQEHAAVWFEYARPFAPPLGITVIEGTIPNGIERMLDAAREGQPLTPEDALPGEERARLILVLADIYHELRELQRSTELCELILARKHPAAPNQRSWAYYRRARNAYVDFDGKLDWEGVLADYQASALAAPTASWADNALFLSANVVYNFPRNKQRAMSLWEELIRRYPKSEEAHRAAYFIAVAWEGMEDYPRAIATFEEFLKKYPDSPFCVIVRELHIPRAQAALRGVPPFPLPAQGLGGKPQPKS